MATAILGSASNRLPTELVLLVVESLAHDRKSLCTLAQTCRALQHIAEEQIYRTIELATVHDLRDIIYAFTRRRDRALAVHTLKLHYQYHTTDLDSTLESRSVFNECIARMTNLREWYIESPYDNCHWDEGEGPEQWVHGDMGSFREALELACTEGPAEAVRLRAESRLGNVVDRRIGLALLESLTIHSHGTDSDFWPLGDFHCLFRHPTLRHLHISCVELTHTDGIPGLHSPTIKTPLETLIFDECEINSESLRDILRMPANLTHLVLGENVWNTRFSRRSNPRLTRNARATIDALGAVAHSLKTLIHKNPSWPCGVGSHKASRMSVWGDGMRNFHALKLVQCETSSFLHQAIIMNRELAPPNLQTLRLSRFWHEPVSFYECLPDVEPYLGLPSLAQLELMQASHPRNELSNPVLVFDADRVQNLHAFAFKLHRAGITMKMLVEMHKDRLIPPYLYGEKEPITGCVYNSAEVGFALGPTSDPSDDGTPTDRNEQLETDQLSPRNLTRITLDAHIVVDKLKAKYISAPRRMTYAAYMAEHLDDEEADPFALELDDDFDEDDMDFEVDEDDMNIIFHEHEGELYVEVYESEWETDSEDSEEDEMEEEAEDVETHPDLD